MNRYLTGGVLLAGAVLLGGCAGTGERPDERQPAELRDIDEGGLSAEERAAREAEVDGLAPGAPFAGNPLEDPDSPLSQRVFYFDFDSAEVRAEDRPIITAHAEYLADNPEASVVVEGHTDERGSREYNLALGERRAQAVEKLLLLQGATRDQLQVISFGEERPVALGHDESAWQLNRRVELLYSGY